MRSLDSSEKELLMKVLPSVLFVLSAIAGLLLLGFVAPWLIAAAVAVVLAFAVRPWLSNN